jgi:hypothetical protein
MLPTQFNARAGAVACFKTLAETVGASSTPYLVSVLPALLKLYGDKEKSVRSAAEEAAPVLISALPAYATKVRKTLCFLLRPPALTVLLHQNRHNLSLHARGTNSPPHTHTYNLSADSLSLTQSVLGVAHVMAGDGAAAAAVDGLVQQVRHRAGGPGAAAAGGH